MDREQLVYLSGLGLFILLALLALYLDGRLVCVTSSVDSYMCQVLHSTLRFIFPRAS